MVRDVAVFVSLSFSSSPLAAGLRGVDAIASPLTGP
jgi:hypothetical protein